MAYEGLKSSSEERSNEALICRREAYTFSGQDINTMAEWLCVLIAEVFELEWLAKIAAAH